MFVAHPHAEATPHSVTRRVERRPTPVDTVEVDSAGLLNGQRELLIRHGSECYRLRHTRNDKLILTK